NNHIELDRGIQDVIILAASNGAAQAGRTRFQVPAGPIEFCFINCCRLPVPNLQSLRSWASSMLSPLACITVFMFPSMLTLVALFSSF
ncbi:hypothetical protein L9F63_026567, partial [Diploptera punctata]